jgi:hypothetical protein
MFQPLPCARLLSLLHNVPLSGFLTSKRAIISGIMLGEFFAIVNVARELPARDPCKKPYRLTPVLPLGQSLETGIPKSIR